VNLNEAKTILLLYRPGTADAEDPQIAEALALAKHEPELARWLADNSACQTALRGKFRQLTAPAGLKEQIISEQAARERVGYWRPRLALVAAVVVMLLGSLAIFSLPRAARDDTLAIYRNQMAGIALRGYSMDLATNDPAQIRTYLAQNHAPADFVLPDALQKAVLTGCAVEGWQTTKVSMICFHTGRPLPPNRTSDLWLFVVDRAALKDAPAALQVAVANRLLTATWTQGDKVYLLGIEGNETEIRQFL